LLTAEFYFRQTSLIKSGFSLYIMFFSIGKNIRIKHAVVFQNGNAMLFQSDCKNYANLLASEIRISF